MNTSGKWLLIPTGAQWGPVELRGESWVGTGSPPQHIQLGTLQAEPGWLSWVTYSSLGPETPIQLNIHPFSHQPNSCFCKLFIITAEGPKDRD